MTSSITVKSSYRSLIDWFDNRGINPGENFVIAGLDKPLFVHLIVLAQASSTLSRVSNGEEDNHVKYDIAGHRIEWQYYTERDGVYRSVLVKWLRFCYGEDQTFSPEECPAALCALDHLQLTCRDEVRKTLIDYMVNTARKDVNSGAQMLCRCVQNYNEECQADIDIALSRVVFSRDNI